MLSACLDHDQSRGVPHVREGPGTQQRLGHSGTSEAWGSSQSLGCWPDRASSRRPMPFQGNPHPLRGFWQGSGCRARSSSQATAAAPSCSVPRGERQPLRPLAPGAEPQPDPVSCRARPPHPGPRSAGEGRAQPGGRARRGGRRQGRRPLPAPSTASRLEAASARCLGRVGLASLLAASRALSPERRQLGPPAWGALFPVINELMAGVLLARRCLP